MKSKNRRRFISGKVIKLILDSAHRWSASIRPHFIFYSYFWDYLSFDRIFSQNIFAVDHIIHFRDSFHSCFLSRVKRLWPSTVKHRKSAKLPWHHNIKLSFWSFSPFVLLSLCLFVFLSFCLFVFLFFFYILTCLSFCLYVCLSFFVFLSFFPFVFLFFCPDITLIKCLKGLRYQKSLFVSKF